VRGQQRLAVRAHRELDGQPAPRTGGTGLRVVVLPEVDRGAVRHRAVGGATGVLGQRDARDAHAAEVGYVRLLRVWRHGGGDREGADRAGLYGARLHVDDHGVVGQRVRRDDRLAVVAGPVRVRVRGDPTVRVGVDPAGDLGAAGGQLDDVRARVDADHQVVGVGAGHDVRRVGPDLDLADGLTGLQVEHVGLVVEPLVRVQEPVVLVRPHVVGVVHVDP